MESGRGALAFGAPAQTRVLRNWIVAFLVLRTLYDAPFGFYAAFTPPLQQFTDTNLTEHAAEIYWEESQ